MRPRRPRPLVTVYTRQGCGLCAVAERIVLRAARRRADVELVDVDRDPGLAERYGVRVPVVVIDGEERFELEVDAREFRRALRAARRRSLSGPGL